MNTIIGVMSDFTQDYYHGVMKAVISKSGPITFVDLPVRHNQSIINASWVLLNSLDYFPKGSIILIVVDPGVGSDRKAIVAKLSNYWIVLPDNGIITPLLERIEKVYSLDIPDTSSNTFHGRDVFAPAVSAIIDDTDFGEPLEITELINLDNPINIQGNSGIVVDIDSFGNIVTNIQGKQNIEQVEFGILNKEYRFDYVNQFDQLAIGEVGVTTGSCGTYEIIRNQGSGSNMFRNISIGTVIKLID